MKKLSVLLGFLLLFSTVMSSHSFAQIVDGTDQGQIILTISNTGCIENSSGYTVRLTVSDGGIPWSYYQNFVVGKASYTFVYACGAYVTAGGVLLYQGQVVSSQSVCVSGYVYHSAPLYCSSVGPCPAGNQ